MNFHSYPRPSGGHAYATKLNTHPSASNRGLAFNEIPVLQPHQSPVTQEDLQAAQSLQGLSRSGEKATRVFLGTATPGADDKSLVLNSWLPQRDAMNSPSCQARRRLNLEEMGSPVLGRAEEISFKTPTPAKVRRLTSSGSSRRGSPGSRSGGRKAGSPSNNSRYDSSLLLLTRRFLNLIQSCPESSINLNEAAEALSVQKRRLYDITNVLEGIDLIEKMGKNSIRWKQADQDAASNAQASNARDEVDALEAEERRLDELIGAMQGGLRLATENPDNRQYAFLRYEDLREECVGMRDETIIAVKAPPDTSLEVPDPKETGKLQMLIKSSSQVEVFLCPDLDACTAASDNNPLPPPIHPSQFLTPSSQGEADKAASLALLDGLEGFSPTKSNSCFLSQAASSGQHGGVDGGLGMSLEPLGGGSEDYLFGLAPDEGLSDLFSDPFPATSLASLPPCTGASVDPSLGGYS